MIQNSPTIHWHEIHEKYPKAFSRFWDYITEDGSMCDFDIESLENQILVLGGRDFTNFIHFNRGNLYHFFDENNLEVYIRPVVDMETAYIVKSEGVNYFISDGIRPIFSPKDSTLHHTRKDAESAAFMKAFELLNNKLTNK